MTPQQFIEKQKRRLERVEKNALRVAAFETHRIMANRIFNEGEAANESLIGNYNTTNPLYVNPKNSPKKFPTGGKTGKVFKNKQPHKTAFFYSYRDFKNRIGQPTDKVRLSLFGRMQSDFANNALTKVSDTEYVVRFKNGINLLKARGHEKKWGKKIFSNSQSERRLFEQVLRQEINRMMNA